MMRVESESITCVKAGPYREPAFYVGHITETSKWAWWRLKSPASRLFTQSFAQADQRKHQNFASLAFVRGGHRRPVTLHWRHNDQDGVSNHQPHGCLLNRLFRRRSKKTSKLRVTGLCVGNSPGPVNSPQKGPVTRKMFPFDDVIMNFSHTGTVTREMFPFDDVIMNTSSILYAGITSEKYFFLCGKSWIGSKY